MRGRSTRFHGRSGTCWWQGAPRRRKSGWRRSPTNASESKRIRKTVSSCVKLCTYININSRSRNKFKDCMFNTLPWFIKLVILICGFRNISILLIWLNLPQSDKRFPVLNKLWDISILSKLLIECGELYASQTPNCQLHFLFLNMFFKRCLNLLGWWDFNPMHFNLFRFCSSLLEKDGSE